MSDIKSVVFGIDLGTTNTVISYFEDNKAKVLNDGAFKLIPSKIYISPENKIVTVLFSDFTERMIMLGLFCKKLQNKNKVKINRTYFFILQTSV